MYYFVIKKDIRASLWLSGKESACQCRRHRFDPWSRTILRAAEQLSLCATTTEPVCYSQGAATGYRPQLLKLVHLEPVLCNRGSHCNENPLTTAKE